MTSKHIFADELADMQHDLQTISRKLNNLKSVGCETQDLENRLEILKLNVNNMLNLLERSIARPLHALH